MIYNLLYPLSTEIGLFNVFRYITFRSIWALLTALLLTIVIGPAFIDWLRRIKFGQQIHEDVAKHKQKAGTPTMGGLLMGFSLLVACLLWADLTNVYVWLSMFVFAGFGFVGFLDDYVKVSHKQNKGLSPAAKMSLQLLVAGLAMFFLIQQPAYDTHLVFPFLKGLRPDLGWFYLPFAVLVIVGASNAVNLTDGLDGLAIGPSIVAGACFAIFVYVTGHAQIANYLNIPHLQGMGEVTVFCGALVGAGLGFLWFNAYPAQVFMGDVGSLSIGATLGFIAVLCKHELVLVIVGGLFVVETLSVILQVGYFKFSGGKRIFRMAPLHHHFELKGIPESKIIIRFWILSLLLALMALSTLKLR
ncbi:phospho-N-acetylmuramoyl-pentapeptide-transferase [Desulfobaculum bizertense]|uniref:Phospho-N-acetylmuramoyl-pentapeptide-transferase n=1 Tax=Desulfobaculum bizertense DSM 18034 TaxID=1121442 RepID=A0A1T4VXF3_9BACT|nr:phospho-N-acetylmuramoyl-pentapeptide-transferase [Desulfobaculum bizertense]UIJ36926.1 phospho-N-acetylmuramoyl-pentapeptide-transferase [Desulfobaculum bizertense]SKA69673.1 Phospho-N-acetylmuramoyl-pentapeptide-transferase [Desulfobaculum bizertense DSM 18034]